MKSLTTVFDKIDRVLGWIAAATMFVMMVWIFLDVMLRFLFNSPIQGTIELTGEYLMVILVYFAISQTQKYDEHVKVTFFEEKFSTGLKKMTKILTNLLAAPLFLFIAFLNFQEGLEYAETGIKSVGLLGYPLAPALFIIAAGLFMIAVRLLLEAVTMAVPSFTDASKKLEDQKQAGDFDMKI